jgi:NET1-associated nuclear protein 1 (U3 small nucleolar RNA-associated protein 17)
VVVIWQLLTGIRQFLPRVGDKVVAISITPDQRYYALTLQDNSVRLIEVLSLTIHKSIKGLIYAGGAPPTGLVLDPLHLRIAMNAKPGSLQFYRPSDDAYSPEFEVASIPPATKEVPRNGVLVDHVCFSFDGKWMVTSERLKYPYGNLGTQATLKFWRFSHKLNDFGLNTRISEPHKNVLTSLLYHPTKDIVVTTSKDGKFKTWNNFVEKEGHTYWIARSVGVFRDYPATSSSFSPDGSLLAVGFQNNVTLWDLKSHTILTSFSDIHLHESISRLAFLAQDSPYLVAHTKSRVTVWNLLSCKPWWSVELTVDAFTSDPKSTRFAVATRGTIYSSSPPNPPSLLAYFLFTSSFLVFFHRFRWCSILIDV